MENSIPTTPNTMTNGERLAIRKQAHYILDALEAISKSGDAFCSDERLFRACKASKAEFTAAQYRTDKALLTQAGFLRMEGTRIYAAHTWAYEEAAAERLAAILKSPALPNVIRVPSGLCANGVVLNEEQRAAVEGALNNRLFLILGGAGCGKTTLIAAAARAYTESTERLSNIVVAAPTGKAARNLYERTGLHARTVHSALGKIPDEDFLDAVSWDHTGLVIIDEGSMLSLEMLAGILNRVNENCRVVLLGDPNQLLSVGAGNVLPDLLELGVPSIRLTQQYRQSEDAEALRRNVVGFPKFPTERELRWDDSFRLLAADDSSIPDLVCREAARRYRAGESVQVLSPTNSATAFSVAALNARLQNMLNPKGKDKQTWKKFRDGDRVIVTKNNSDFDICNGDVGVLHISDEKPYRCATLELTDRVVRWTLDRPEDEESEASMPQLALAYALTVHKSQGSQYDTILMPASMAASKMLYRNLLYTAISRAKHEVILVGSREAVNVAMQCVPYPRKSMLVAKTNMLRFNKRCA